VIRASLAGQAAFATRIAPLVIAFSRFAASGIQVPSSMDGGEHPRSAVAFHDLAPVSVEP